MSTHTRRLSRRAQTWRLGPRAWRSRRQRPTAHGPVWPTVAVGVAAVALVIAIVIACLRSMAPAEPERAEADTVPTGQDVAVQLSAFSDGRAHFFRYVTPAGRETRFFIVKGADGDVRAAFDACDACFRERRGFRQVGDHLVCNSCGRPIAAQRVGLLTGGCNPVPLERSIDGDRIIVRAATIESGASYF